MVFYSMEQIEANSLIKVYDCIKKSLMKMCNYAEKSLIKMWNPLVIC